MTGAPAYASAAAEAAEEAGATAGVMADVLERPTRLEESDAMGAAAAGLRLGWGSGLGLG
jgi:hypothetical protein